MKIYNRFVRVLVIILSVTVFSAVLAVLALWTGSIKSSRRQSELKTAMSEVVGKYGERALLEMAGVPVNDIYYGDSGITLFQGDSASWNYSSDEIQNITIYGKAQKAVVYISTVSEKSVSSFLDVNSKSGVGSGFFISYDGYICTNRHVVNGASSITVRTAEGVEYKAVIVGTDPENDIAVLKVTDDNPDKVFDYLEFGDSGSLSIGQKVLAIGNPFGYENSMSQGIISGLSRPIRDENGQVLLGMIQTDVNVNPGNSGGPLLNTQGKVIGVVSSIYSSNGANQGMNFALASDTAKSSSNDLIKFGKVNRGWLDIVPVQLTKQIVDYAGLKVSRGILVSQVAPLGKADKSGLRGGNSMAKYGNSVIYLGGDVITSVNGVSVEEYGDLFTALSQTRPGDKVDVIVNRNGSEVKLKVELAERTTENVNWINR